MVHFAKRGRRRIGNGIENWLRFCCSAPVEGEGGSVSLPLFSVVSPLKRCKEEKKNQWDDWTELALWRRRMDEGRRDCQSAKGTTVSTPPWNRLLSPALPCPALFKEKGNTNDGAEFGAHLRICIYFLLRISLASATPRVMYVRVMSWYPVSHLCMYIRICMANNNGSGSNCTMESPDQRKGEERDPDFFAPHFRGFCRPIFQPEKKRKEKNLLKLPKKSRARTMQWLIPEIDTLFPLIFWPIVQCSEGRRRRLFFHISLCAVCITETNAPYSTGAVEWLQWFALGRIFNEKILF